MYLPVTLRGFALISDGVPVATTRPPALPPPGPMSTTQSAARMTSRSCSITSTVTPRAAGRLAAFGLRPAPCHPPDEKGLLRIPGSPAVGTGYVHIGQELHVEADLARAVAGRAAQGAGVVGEADDLPKRDVDVNVPEVVLPCPAHLYRGRPCILHIVSHLPNLTGRHSTRRLYSFIAPCEPKIFHAPAPSRWRMAARSAAQRSGSVSTEVIKTGAYLLYSACSRVMPWTLT